MSTYHILLKRPNTMTRPFEGASETMSPAIEIGVDERSWMLDLHVYSEALATTMYTAHGELTDVGATHEVAEKLTFADLRILRDNITKLLRDLDEDKNE